MESITPNKRKAKIWWNKIGDSFKQHKLMNTYFPAAPQARNLTDSEIEHIYNEEMKSVVKVIRTTPFDPAGTVLSMQDFRLKYSYLFMSYVSDIELIEHLREWTKNPVPEFNGGANPGNSFKILI